MGEIFWLFFIQCVDHLNHVIDVTNQTLTVPVSVWGERSRRISLSTLCVWILSMMCYGG